MIKQKREIAENIREIMAPHFYVTKSLDGVSLSAHINDEHYNKAEDELSEYLMKNDFLAEDHVSFKLNIEEMDLIKEYNFLPLVMKRLGFKTSTSISDQ